MFPATDDRSPFCLLTLGHIEREIRFAFSLVTTSDITDERRRFTLTPDDIALINPNTRTCPIFRTGHDALLTKKVYQRVPALIDKSKGGAGNAWGVRLRTMLHKTNASRAGHLKPAMTAQED